MVMRTASGSTSRRTARMVLSGGGTGACARSAIETAPAITIAHAPRAAALPELRIHFLEVALVHQHLASLASRARRHDPIHLHHVDEPRGAAESDPQAPLQVRDRRLAAAH